MKAERFAMGVVAAMLAGCAGIESDVRASLPDSPAFDAGARTYVFATSPVPAADADARHYESAVADALAKDGYDAVPDERARLRVSLAFDTHAEPVSILDEVCEANGDCTPPRQYASFRWPGREWFVHSLTLRFFDRASGREIYKVSASSRDREAEPAYAIPYLVESAFARMPYRGSAHWRVRLRRGEPGNGPAIVSITPAQR